jgi:hypothetical protein
MNKLNKQTIYIPCGNQVTHFKVKCDPDDEGNYMQCNVKKEENKYVLSEEELEKVISDAVDKCKEGQVFIETSWGHRTGDVWIDGESLDEIKKEYINSIL